MADGEVIGGAGDIESGAGVPVDADLPEGTAVPEGTVKEGASDERANLGESTGTVLAGSPEDVPGDGPPVVEGGTDTVTPQVAGAETTTGGVGTGTEVGGAGAGGGVEVFGAGLDKKETVKYVDETWNKDSKYTMAAGELERIMNEADKSEAEVAAMTEEQKAAYLSNKQIRDLFKDHPEWIGMAVGILGFMSKIDAFGDKVSTITDPDVSAAGEETQATEGQTQNTMSTEDLNSLKNPVDASADLDAPPSSDVYESYSYVSWVLGISIQNPADFKGRLKNPNSNYTEDLLFSNLETNFASPDLINGTVIFFKTDVNDPNSEIPAYVESTPEGLIKLRYYNNGAVALFETLADAGINAQSFVAFYQPNATLKQDRLNNAKTPEQKIEDKKTEITVIETEKVTAEASLAAIDKQILDLEAELAKIDAEPDGTVKTSKQTSKGAEYKTLTNDTRPSAVKAVDDANEKLARALSELGVIEQEAAAVTTAAGDTGGTQGGASGATTDTTTLPEGTQSEEPVGLESGEDQPPVDPTDTATPDQTTG